MILLPSEKRNLRFRTFLPTEEGSSQLARVLSVKLDEVSRASTLFFQGCRHSHKEKAINSLKGGNSDREGFQSEDIECGGSLG